MTSATARIHRWRGAAAVTLSSGELEATFIPERNMLGVSLRLGGQGFIALPGGLAAYARRSATGLPLLAPWANRLAGLTYRAAGMRVDLSDLDVTTDPNGLPIHGTMWREPWDIESVSTRGQAARLRTGFDYERTDLLAAFPFPHRLEMAIEVDGRSLSITTSVVATGTRAVPVSFGFHPYLRLPRGRRSTWRLILPERRHLRLDDRMIPTGRTDEEPAEVEPIGARTFDDGYELTGDETLGIEGAGRRSSVRFEQGFPYAQVYAPPEASFVCLEPMTAPTNGLATGRCPLVQPGETYSARFSIRPERLG